MRYSKIRNIDTLLGSTSPYFDPDYVRLEAAGAIAAQGLRQQEYRGRIVLAKVTAITPKQHWNLRANFCVFSSHKPL